MTPEGYAHMTHMLGAVAPLAVLLEGGYNLRATAAGCEAVLRVLLGQKVPAFSRPAVAQHPWAHGHSAGHQDAGAHHRAHIFVVHTIG